MKTQDVVDLALAAGLYQDGDMFFSPTTGDADVHISDLKYFAKTVEERALSRQKASYYQEGYEAGLDIKSKLMQDALYLLGAWERGAEADDYVMDLWHLRQKFDVYAKQGNSDTSAKRAHKTDISDTANKSEILDTADKQEHEPWDTTDMAHRPNGMTIDITDLVNRAKAEEREACAKLCLELIHYGQVQNNKSTVGGNKYVRDKTAHECATEIRGRTE
jgi:hypothetical protein